MKTLKEQTVPCFKPVGLFMCVDVCNITQTEEQREVITSYSFASDEVCIKLTEGKGDRDREKEQRVTLSSCAFCSMSKF